MLLLRRYRQATQFDRKVGQLGTKQQTNEHLFSLWTLLLIYSMALEVENKGIWRFNPHQYIYSLSISLSSSISTHTPS